MRKSGRYLLIPVVFAALLLLSACNANIGGSGTTSNLTVLQVLQKSSDAMKNLKSSHVDLQSTNSVQTNGAAATPTSSATPVASGTPTSDTVSIKGSGDQALPDQMQMNLTVNQNQNISEILNGDQVYVKGTDGKWYVVDKKNVQGALGNTFSNFSFNENDLLGLLANTQISDHGDQSLNGQTLRHISATLDRDALKQLLENNPQLVSQFGQQNVDDVVNNLKSFTSTVDVWIDETTFYLHRTELKLNLQANTSQVGMGAPAAVASNNDIIVDLSDFNKTVTITPPSNATPITDTSSLLKALQ